MQAVIVDRYGATPVFGARPEPGAGPGETLVRVEASAITQLVKAQVSGRHYSMREATHPSPFTPGADGVGRTPDGRRVYFAFPTFPHGAMAETSAVRQELCVTIPETLDPAHAAAIANPGMSSWAALTRRARMKPGQTVWVMGATGASGGLAINVARMLGAGRVVALGRGDHRAQELVARGADAFISLEDAGSLAERIAAEALAKAPDVILDYLWGPPAEAAMRGLASAHLGSPCVWTQIGSVAGDPAHVPAALLRAAPVTLIGSGVGSVALPELIKAVGEFLAVADRIAFDYYVAPFQDVSSLGRVLDASS